MTGMGAFILLMGSIFGPAGAFAWRLYNQRQIWVGKYKVNSVKVAIEGRKIKVILDDKEIFLTQSWRKEGVYEFECDDLELGVSSGVVVVRITTMDYGHKYQMSLILNGEAIELTQLPSSLFKEASFQQAEQVFKAQSILDKAPKQDLQRDEILNLCRDIRELSPEDFELHNSVKHLQEQLIESLQLVRRIEKALASYEELGVENSKLLNSYEQALEQKQDVFELLMDLHASVISGALVQKSDNAQVVEKTRQLQVENDLEDRMNEFQRKKAHRAALSSTQKII